MIKVYVLSVNPPSTRCGSLYNLLYDYHYTRYLIRRAPDYLLFF
jgi:hypothetical protein